VVFLVFIAVFQPWGFYLGGTFHLIPYWQGVGHNEVEDGPEVRGARQYVAGLADSAR
jgi:hypothetical protein